ncbi:gamma-glutamylcyclotransferase [Shewanella canadensis]|uniref:Gamma-glutamylcyclotransferase n=1 Tax=Shewanella canadensis TaxID=271096 RepID=A0A3S0J7P3_9GAMM|nr:gamma-glutamylcyclotransferase family protein [Shewanella canadensis]RTR39686.1 gamma-glutamylcyclotransferase [Shewanella canadensis]
MKYFAYSSNMSLLRLRQRVPSVEKVGVFVLKAHELRFHKIGKDGSGKCDAFRTNNIDDVVIGAIFEINEDEKEALDRAEGLGYGYGEKTVNVQNDAGDIFEVFTYCATKTDSSLQPFSWYLNHVVIGAKETNVPTQYLAVIESIECIEDPDKNRDSEQRAIYHLQSLQLGS